jgi:nitrite reductase/ring-hydroxylating ferredoxin subunit
MNADQKDYPLAANSSCSVTVEGRPLLLVRHGDTLKLYENRCPHTGQTLDPLGRSVVEAQGALITCERHGAQFLSSSGECVAGPCLGESLTSVPFTAVGGEIYLD